MKIFKNCLIILAIPFLTGCATIVSKSKWPFSIDTNPAGAKVVITNRKGAEIFSGRTPTALRLNSGAGFFIKEAHVVTLSMNGYETKKMNIDCKINGWYFGNILLGGLIGFLIVDPATGAMYKLDSDGIFQNLMPYTKTAATPSLNIMDINQIPKELALHLIKLN